MVEIIKDYTPAKRPTKQLRKRNLKRRTPCYTFSDVLRGTMDEVEQSYSMLIYEHPTNLSPEQVIFVLEFIKSGYKAVPAIQNTFGHLAEEWVDRKCQAVASRLLDLPKVKSFLNEQLEARAEKLKVTADWVALKYKQWAQIDVAKYIEVAHHEKTKRPYIKLKTNLNDMPEQIRSAIKEVSVTQAGDLKVVFVDQKAALDSLSKLMGFTDNKVTIETKAPIIMHFDAQDENA